MNKQRFRNLKVWQAAMEFIEVVYKTTSEFPKSEIYGLSSQLRKSAISIALNIAEGSGSDSNIEFNRFLNISLRSAYETICALEITKRLNYSNDNEINELFKKCDEISAMIFGLKKKLKADN
jgi:four helix bundle protein